MRFVFGEIHLNARRLQSSIGYSRVWTEGAVYLILARLVDPQDGSARQLSKGNQATRRDREDSCPQRAPRRSGKICAFIPIASPMSTVYLRFARPTNTLYFEATFPTRGPALS
jgi:hypothetical protein